MTQDIFVLFYLILFLFQNDETTAMTLRNDPNESPNKCLHCEPPKKEKNPRRTFTKDKKFKYFQKLNENFYKYKYSLSKGWGAAGMPFNVLYTPNAYHQKILKSVLQREQSGKYSQLKAVPEIYNLVLEDEKPRTKVVENTTQNTYKPRKYYSLIPQLFVSYGW